MNNENLSRREKFWISLLLAGAVGNAALFAAGFNSIPHRNIDEAKRTDRHPNLPSLTEAYSQRAKRFLGRQPVRMYVEKLEIPPLKTLTIPKSVFPKPQPRLTSRLKHIGYEEVPGPMDEYLYQAPAKLPPALFKGVAEEVKTVNKVLRRDNQISRVNLFPLYNDQQSITGVREISLNGYPDPTHHSIAIEIQPGKKVEPREVRQMAFHESMHVFQEQASMDPIFNEFDVLDKDRLDTFKLMADIMQARGLDSTNFWFKTVGGGDPHHDDRLGPLISVVDESSYYGKGGHPYSDPDELFASATTVMRFFPQSFMSTVDELRPTDKKIMVNLASDCLSILRRSGRSQAAADNLFSDSLIDYLQTQS